MIVSEPFSDQPSGTLSARIAKAALRDNVVLSFQSRSLEYEIDYPGAALRCAWNGRETSIADGRRWVVDDDTWLFLPRGRFQSQLKAASDIHSLTVLFRPGLPEEVAASMLGTDEALMDSDRHAPTGLLWPWPHLQLHDRSITPVLQFIRRTCDLGVDDPLWYEEQLGFLLQRMIQRHRQSAVQGLKLVARRSSTRKEIIRRLSLATDFIHSNYERALSLADMAAAAHLSRHHFLRLFKAFNEVTPYEYLQRKRTTAAARLLRDSELPVEDIVRRVGFDSRSTLFRAMRRFHGLTPTQCRRIVEPLAFAGTSRLSA